MTKRFLAGLAAIAALGTAGLAHAQDNIDEVKFNVVGTWNTLSAYNKFEEPFFTKTLPEASGGKITAEMAPVNQTGLKGFEFVRLLRQGVFDFGLMTMGYVSGDVPEIDGFDLAGLAQTYEDARKIAEAWQPVVQEALDAKDMNVLLLGIYPFPSQVFFCNAPVSGIGDLGGKKIRTYSATLSDFVNGVDGTNVTVAFAEVVPALQRGVVDCGITGSASGWNAKWWEVATHMYTLRMGFGLNGVFANKEKFEALSPETQELIKAEMAKMIDELWTFTEEEDVLGVACSTKTGDWETICPEDKIGAMTLVEPSEDETAMRQKVLEEQVLPGFRQRCGDECAKKWNETIGSMMGVQIPL